MCRRNSINSLLHFYIDGNRVTYINTFPLYVILIYFPARPRIDSRILVCTKSIILCPGEISREFVRIMRRWARDFPYDFTVIELNRFAKRRISIYFLLYRENLHHCWGIGMDRGNGSDDQSLINPLCLIKEQSLCGN